MANGTTYGMINSNVLVLV